MPSGGRMARVAFVVVSLLMTVLTGAAVPAAIHEVTLLDQAPFYSSGPTVKVAVGDTVRWKNPMTKDGATHTVTQQGCFTGDACEFDSGVMAPGAEFRHVFAQAGTYRYRCRLHAPMEGMIVVNGQ
jgi:plastocyanin